MSNYFAYRLNALISDLNKLRKEMYIDSNEDRNFLDLIVKLDILQKEMELKQKGEL